MVLVAGVAYECLVALQTACKKSVSRAWTQIDLLAIVALSFANGPMFIIPQEWSFALKHMIAQNL
jgi:hypothetical protein